MGFLVIVCSFYHLGVIRIAMCGGSGCHWVTVPSRVEEIVPVCLILPMVENAGINALNVHPSFARKLKSAVVFLLPKLIVWLIKTRDTTAPIVLIKLFKRIKLFEEVEIAFIAAFEGLIGLLPLVNIACALPKARVLCRPQRVPMFILPNCH